MEMTRERLEAYRSEKDEIVELKYKLVHLGEGDSLIGSDTIFNYRTGFPKPQTVVGYDYNRERELRNTYRKRIERLEAKCAEVEQWVEAIPDSLTRRIFRMYFLEGIKQKKIAKSVHLSQSKISEKISDFLNRDKKDKKV